MTATDAILRPRPAPVTFDEPIPRHWFGGIAIATHVANGVNLLFPAGERFFIRSVRRYLDRVEDPALLEQIKGFFGQEGRHAGAHERFFEVLEAQGYQIRRFLSFYEWFCYDVLENNLPRSLSLAVTVALEHFTAILAEDALSDDILTHAHPTVQKLLLWHAAEEIEHKSVAFDVLKQVNPSYALRMAGLAVAALSLGGFWVAATLMLLSQDRRRGDRGALRAFRAMKRKGSISRRVFYCGIREYIRRDFHPSQNDNYHLAKEYLGSQAAPVSHA
jgi:uncharacterized protein